MSEAAIRTAIYNAINGVAQVGLVYDYERHATEWGDFLDLFKSTIGGTAQIRGWMIGYRGIQSVENSRFSGAGRIARTHRFQVLGVMGIDDSEATEKTFAALAEDVCDALDSDSTLHPSTQSGQNIMNTAPASFGFDPSPFAGILVHAAAITIEVTESI